MKISPEDLAALVAARGWARFAYAVTLTGTLVLALAVFGVGLRAVDTRSAAWALMAVLVGAVAFLTGLYATLLRRYVRGVSDHLARDGSGLTRAFRALKSWWIYTVVFGSAMALGTLVMILALLAGAPLDPPR